MPFYRCFPFFLPHHYSTWCDTVGNVHHRSFSWCARRAKHWRWHRTRAYGGTRNTVWFELHRCIHNRDGKCRCERIGDFIRRAGACGDSGRFHCTYCSVDLCCYCHLLDQGPLIVLSESCCSRLTLQEALSFGVVNVGQTMLTHHTLFGTGTIGGLSVGDFLGYVQAPLTPLDEAMWS